MIMQTQIFKAKGCQKKKHQVLFTLIMLDSVVKAKRKYYLQTHLEECKYESKKIKMEKLINDDLEKSSSDESDNDSGDETESEDEKDNDETDE